MRPVRFLAFLGLLSALSAGHLGSTTCNTYSNSRAIISVNGLPACGDVGAGCVECVGSSLIDYCVKTIGGAIPICVFPENVAPDPLANLGNTA